MGEYDISWMNMYLLNIETGITSSGWKYTYFMSRRDDIFFKK